MTFLNSAKAMPIGTPVAWSISGASQIGSKPARTSALKTDRWAVLETAIFSPGFPSAKMIA